MQIKKELASANKIATFTFTTVIFLALAKVVVGYLTRSIALFADGLHSFADVLVAGLALFAVRILAKKPSERFPYGYYKVEDLTTSVISLVFLFTALGIIFNAVNSIMHFQRSPTIESVAVPTAIASSFISLYLAHKQEKIAKETGIRSLLLNSREMRYDGLASILVVASILTAKVVIFPFEEFIAILIAFLIVRIAITNIKESLLNLLDAWEKPEILRKIREIIASKSVVKKIKMIRVRKAGPLIFGDAIVEVDPDESIESIHKLIDAIEAEIKIAIPNLVDIIIHTEPAEKQEYHICVPLDDTKGEASKISDHFGKAPFIAHIKVNMDNKIFEIISIEQNPYKNRKLHAGVKIAKMLGSKKIDCIIIRNIGEAAFLSLKGFLITIYRTNKKVLRDAIFDFIKHNLEPLSTPTKEE